MCERGFPRFHEKPLISRGCKRPASHTPTALSAPKRTATGAATIDHALAALPLASSPQPMTQLPADCRATRARRQHNMSRTELSHPNPKVQHNLCIAAQRQGERTDLFPWLSSTTEMWLCSPMPGYYPAGARIQCSKCKLACANDLNVLLRARRAAALSDCGAPGAPAGRLRRTTELGLYVPHHARRARYVKAAPHVGAQSSCNAALACWT